VEEAVAEGDLVVEEGGVVSVAVVGAVAASQAVAAFHHQSRLEGGVARLLPLPHHPQKGRRGEAKLLQTQLKNRVLLHGEVKVHLINQNPPVRIL